MLRTQMEREDKVGTPGLSWRGVSSPSAGQAKDSCLVHCLQGTFSSLLVRPPDPGGGKDDPER